jgi:integrase/recombinase XerD
METKILSKEFPNSKKNFISYLHSMNHSQKSITSYEFIVKNYLKDNPDAMYYGYRDVFNYIKKRILNKFEYKSIYLLQAGIKKYYNFLIKIGIRETHPCTSLFLKQKRSPLIHQDLFSTNDLELLLRRQERYGILKSRNRIIISLLIYQGLTLAELVSLKIKDLNLENGSLHIKRSRTLNSRVLHLTPKQQDLIKIYLKRDRPYLINSDFHSEVLLLNKLGRPISSDVVQYLVETCRVLFPNRKLSASTIRQSVIANWLNIYKIKLDQVQILAGHKCMSTTLKYRKLDMKKQVDLMNKFFPI